MKIAVVGATGLVGQKMLNILAQRNIKAEEVIGAASEKSAGKFFRFRQKEFKIVSVADAINQKPDIVLFSAGGATSMTWAKKFAEQGSFVIDNSSVWRLHNHVPLVVPEINGNLINTQTKIIANPNCSTIQMVLPLATLHRAFGIKRIVVSTYQSVTGSGVKGVLQLENERKGLPVEKAYPHPIDLNVLPQGGDFNNDGYTSEEQKLVDETRKILGDKNIQVSATVVRVPVYGGHSEAVNVEFNTGFELDEIRELLVKMPGIIVKDDPTKFEYPMPIHAEGKDEVFVGRIRRDFSQPNTVNMWVVSDNLRKGAATNAVQIAELIVKKGLV